MTALLVAVADAMLTAPKTCAATTTVGEARLLLGDHVHALLVVRDGVLLAVVERPDLAGVPSGTPAGEVGRLAGRTVGPDVDLAAAWERMRAQRRRRLAVVDGGGGLLGLLCLKRSGRGFCTEAGVLARAHGRVGATRT